MAATVNCQKWKIFLQKQRKPLSSTRVPVADPRDVVVAATEKKRARRGAVPDPVSAAIFAARVAVF
jgi:hypothetical protein